MREIHVYITNSDLDLDRENALIEILYDIIENYVPSADIHALSGEEEPWQPKR